MIKVPDFQNPIKNRKLRRVWWMILLGICIAGSLPGRVKGADMRIPHLQDITNTYLPFVIFHKESKVYLPIMYLIFQNIANQGFEEGYTGWTFNSNQGMDLITQDQAHSGIHSAGLGNGNNYRVTSISQDVTVPTGYSTLAYWIYIDSDDACGWDFLKIYVNSQLLISYDVCSSTSTYQWSSRSLDLSGFAAQTITLKLEYTSDASVGSFVYLDDFQFTSP